jgi:uncharacterized protein (TIGR02145 family)
VGTESVADRTLFLNPIKWVNWTDYWIYKIQRTKAKGLSAVDKGVITNLNAIPKEVHLQSNRAIGLALAMISFSVSPCRSQNVDIKGMVKDGAGVGLAGVVVGLQKSALQAISGADGSFTLNANSTGVIVRPDENQGINPVPAFDPALAVDSFQGLAKGAVWIRVFGAGAQHSWAQVNGVQVGIKPTGIAQPSKEAFRSRNSNLPQQKTSGTSAGFKDVLAATKTGFLTYRMAMVSPTATGLEIRMVASAGTLKDADGNEYQTVKLGNQVWLAEHYRSTKYNDGTDIPKFQDKAGWAKRTTPGFCFYNGMSNVDSIKNFGALYNWYVINTKKLAPTGWHVPGDADWTALQNYLIGSGNNFDNSTSGNKIGKALASRTDWIASTNNGAVGNDQGKNNKSGFSAVPTGFRTQEGDFTSMGNRCIIHSTSDKEKLYGYFADLDNASETLRYSDDFMAMGFVVRLVKD